MAVTRPTGALGLVAGLAVEVVSVLDVAVGASVPGVLAEVSASVFGVPPSVWTPSTER
jgi:hypothetical protein